MRAIFCATAALLAFAGAEPAHALEIKANQVWLNTPVDTSEIVAFDQAKNLFYVAGGSRIDVIDGATGGLVNFIPVPTGFGGVNSVAVAGGNLAIALQADDKTQPGTVQIFDTSNLATPAKSVTVGALPDMLTFTPDGSKILVANEGEPNSFGEIDSVDPEGSISVIDVASGTVQTAGFGAFDKTTLQNAGVRIFGPGSTAAQDLEPEYIAVSPDGQTAFVALQENNALAIVDLSGASPVVTDVVPLGFKDHGLPGNELDPSDRDGGINIRSAPGVLGMFQPDGIVTFEAGGQTFVISANEGDAREWPGFEEEDRVKDLNLAAGAFPANAQDDDQLGRLTITTTPGVTNDFINGADEFEKVFAFGARSFSIWDENGALVFDSGAMIEQIIADQFPDLWQEGRSDNKGPEPEAVEIGEVNGKPILFVGLERTSAIMLFDLSLFDINNLVPPAFVGLIHSAGLLGPEGLEFLTTSAGSFLAVAFEGDDDGGRGTALFRLIEVPEPAALGLAGTGLLMLGLLRRRQRRQG